MENRGERAQDHGQGAPLSTPCSPVPSRVGSVRIGGHHHPGATVGTGQVVRELHRRGAWLEYQKERLHTAREFEEEERKKKRTTEERSPQLLAQKEKEIETKKKKTDLFKV